MRDQRRARLALAAGADQQDPVARHIARLVLGQKARQVGEIAVLARRLVHAPQRAADQRDVAAMRAPPPARSSAAAQHSRRSRRPRPAPSIAADQVDQRLAQLGLGAGRAWPSARWSNRRPSRGRPRRRRGVKAASSVTSPISGSGSNFQSPVCSTVPTGVRMRHRVRLGDRMGQGDQLEVERADREPARQRHDVDLDLVERARPRPASRAAARR